MISWKKEQEIVELALSAPPCNEIGLKMLAELERFVEEASPQTARALIIHSALPSGFSAGADLRELYNEMLARPQAKHRQGMKDFLARIHRLFDTIDQLPVTTIGVIHGVCFGGGFELALTCDVRIAEKSARFAFPELRLGIIPGFGGIPRLKRDIGNAMVRDLLLSGRSINANRAHEIGLVSQVVSAGEGYVVAKRLAQQVEKFDPQAQATAKSFVKPFPKMELEKEQKEFLQLFERPEVIERLRRFVESQEVQPYLP